MDKKQDAGADHQIKDDIEILHSLGKQAGDEDPPKDERGRLENGGAPSPNSVEEKNGENSDRNSVQNRLWHLFKDA